MKMNCPFLAFVNRSQRPRALSLMDDAAEEALLTDTNPGRTKPNWFTPLLVGCSVAYSILKQ